MALNFARLSNHSPIIAISLYHRLTRLLPFVAITRYNATTREARGWLLRLLHILKDLAQHRAQLAGFDWLVEQGDAHAMQFPAGIDTLRSAVIITAGMFKPKC